MSTPGPEASPSDTTSGTTSGSFSPTPTGRAAGRSWWVAAQFALLAVVFVVIAREIATQREALRAAAAALEPRWGLILSATALVLATYAALVQSWRLLMRGWGSELGFGPAVRIWTIANLGRYVPGKVWSVGALVVLARREGVSPVAAAGAAMLGTLLNIGAGFGVIALTGSGVLDSLDTRYRLVTIAGSVGFMLGVLLLPRVLPALLAWLARRRPTLQVPKRPLPARILWLAVAINCVSWAGYGLAFAMLAHGLLGNVSGAVPTFVAIWTASYLVGYLTLIAPGGIGTRDAALKLALVGLGVAVSADATVLVIISRLWLTVLEVVPGLVSLAFAPAARRSRP